MDGPRSTRERIIDVAEELLFQQGFSGTSLNDIMQASQLTKGAFFHHFKNKHDLAHIVLTRWADRDDALVSEFVERAHDLAENPLQEANIFIKLFEEWLGKLEQPSNGCLFASFT
ncbi:MAG: TetR family transcriptional regulator, partial [Gammaproteobacteria bacterium]